MPVKYPVKKHLCPFAKPQTGLPPVFSTLELSTLCTLCYHHSDLLTFSSSMPYPSRILWAFEHRNPPPGGSSLTSAWKTATHLSTLLRCHLLCPVLPGKIRWLWHLSQCVTFFCFYIYFPYWIIVHKDKDYASFILVSSANQVGVITEPVKLGPVNTK